MLHLRIVLTAAICVVGFVAPSVSAQNTSVSPILLLESGPSDNPNYRRMVFTKYLQGDRVRVNYKAYNRTEFIQVSPETSGDIIRGCTRGAATSLNELKAFERAEARERYLGPIFNGLPVTPGSP